MLLVGWQEGHPACKNLQCWGTGMVICLERDADLHISQPMPLPLTVSCSFVVLAHLGSSGQRAVKRVCVCVLMETMPGRCCGPSEMETVSIDV